MTFTIDIDDRLKARLDEEARRRGVAAADYARQLIEQSLPPGNGDTPNRATLELLAQWDREDETSDPAEIARRRQELEDLNRALNDNRTSGRKLFP
jgi:hypothetical protein